MRTILNNRLILILILVMICFICKSQVRNEKQVLKNSISFKFANYNEEMDCKVVKMIEEMKGVKVVFSCINAGLLIVESEQLVGSTLKAWLDDQIKTQNEKIKFDLIESYSLKSTNNTGLINRN